MHILYDHQLFSLENTWGMSKYYVELMEQLLRDGHEITIPVWRTNNSYLLDFLEKYNNNQNLHVPKQISTVFLKKNFKGKNNLLYRYNKFQFFIHKKKLLSWVDLVHMTLFDPYMRDNPKNQHIPYCFTVYDLNHKTQKLPGIRMCDYAEHGIAELAKQAQAIICVSGQTKRDLLKFYPEVDEKLIQVIYHSIAVISRNEYWMKWNSNDEAIYDYVDQIATSEQDWFPVSSQWHVGWWSGTAPLWKYILYIGKRAADYKNFKPFVQAIAPLLSEYLKLKCLGHMEFDTTELELFQKLHIEQFVEKVWWDEQEKFRLLHHASCFVYPSLAEGFGIPILEARNAGAPVLCSAIQVFMEIGQWACLYFDPKNEENMRELIWSVIKNNELQNNLRQAGYDRVKLFDKSVEYNKTLELYSKIVTSNGKNLLTR